MRTFLIIFGGFLFMLALLFLYVWEAPPLPLTKTVGPHDAGSMELRVETSKPFVEGGEIMIDASPNVVRAVVDAIDGDVLTLTEPLPFPIAGDRPATVARIGITTLVAAFDGQVGIRRFPRDDSRVIAYAQAGMWKEVLHLSEGWIKIKIRPEVKGWALAAKAEIDESGVVPEAVFSERVPVRRVPYKDDPDVRWEGRVVKKLIEQDENGEPVYLLRAANQFDEVRLFRTVKGTWDMFMEADYLVDRGEKGLDKIEVPIAFTKPGPPYEVLSRRDAWIEIQIQDQGWVKRSDATLEVRYHYAVSRRQGFSQWIRSKIGL